MARTSTRRTSRGCANTGCDAQPPHQQTRAAHRLGSGHPSLGLRERVRRRAGSGLEGQGCRADTRQAEAGHLRRRPLPVRRPPAAGREAQGHRRAPARRCLAGHVRRRPSSTPWPSGSPRLGFVTWNVEYRRIGDGGGCAEHPPRRRGGDRPARRRRAPRRHHRPGRAARALGRRSSRCLGRVAHPATPGGAPLVRPRGAISLAGILGLTRGGNDPSLASTVSDFVGGSPAQVPERYAVADPEKLLPQPVRCGRSAPTTTSWSRATRARGYVAAAKAAGGTATEVRGPGRPHLHRRALPALVPHHPEGAQPGDGPGQRLTSTARNRSASSRHRASNHAGAPPLGS